MSAVLDEADAVRDVVRAGRLAADELPVSGLLDDRDEPVFRFRRCAGTDPWRGIYRRWLTSPLNDRVDPEPAWDATDDAAFERLNSVDVAGLARWCRCWLDPLADAAERVRAGIGAAETAFGQAWVGGSGTAAVDALHELARCCGIAAESWSLVRARADELVTCCGATARGLLEWEEPHDAFLRYYEDLDDETVREAHAALDLAAAVGGVPDDPRSAAALTWLDDFAARYQATMRAYRDMAGRAAEALDRQLAAFADAVRGTLADCDPFLRVVSAGPGAATPSAGTAGATVASSAGDSGAAATVGDGFTDVPRVFEVHAESPEYAPLWDFLGGVQPHDPRPWWEELVPDDATQESSGSGEPASPPAAAFGEGRSPGEASAFELSPGRPDGDDPRPLAPSRDEDGRELGGRNPDLWW